MRLKENEFCTGCGMCVKACPIHAITLVPDKLGFLRPEINADKCVDCGLCEKLCSARVANDCNKQKFLAVKNKDRQKRIRSSSGGLFCEIAGYVISNKNGVVYGAAYDVENNMQVYHRRINSVDEISLLMGSKYVQSRMGDVYSQIENDLNQDLFVCFSGSPCQVNALKVYLKHKKTPTKKLLTCDFVCHGVPSPMVWNDYVQICQNKYSDKMVDYSFRYKDDDCHWGNANVSARFKEKEITNTQLVRSYINIYLANLITRRDCQNCEFTSLNRVSDITMADCWGIEKVNPKFYSEDGVSLAMVNTEMGAELFENISESFDITEVDVSLLEQPHLYKPCKLSAQSEDFWLRFEKSGYISCAKKYTGYGVMYRTYKKTRSILGSCKKFLMGHRS